MTSWDLNPGLHAPPAHAFIPSRHHCLALGKVTGVTPWSVLVAVASGSEDRMIWRLEVRDEDR